MFRNCLTIHQFDTQREFAQFMLDKIIDGTIQQVLFNDTRERFVSHYRDYTQTPKKDDELKNEIITTYKDWIIVTTMYISTEIVASDKREYDRLYSRLKRKEYYQRNKETINERNKKNYKLNKDTCWSLSPEYKRNHYLKNRERYNESNKERYRIKIKNQIENDIKKMLDDGRVDGQ